MAEVPRIVTPLEEVDAAHIMVNTLLIAGIKAHQAMASLLLAQLWFETLHGQKVNNKNVGNLSVFDTFKGDFFRPAWFTVDANSSPDMQALHARMLNHQAPSAFESYPSFEASIADYIAKLKQKFPTILAAADSGDASAMAQAIKTSGYTPDAPPDLAKTLSSIATDFQRRGTFKTLPLARPVAAVQGPTPSAALQPSPSSSPSSTLPFTPSGSSVDVHSLPTLQLGSSGVYVRIVKRILGIVPVTDPFDAAMKDRVEIEQTILGTTSDGVVGPETWKRLLQ